MMKDHPKQRFRGVGTLMAYGLGVPGLAALYAFGFMALRGWDWYGHPNPAIDFTVKAIRSVLAWVLVPPAVAMSYVVPGSVSDWGHGLGLAIMTGLVLGVAIACLFDLTAKR